MRCAQMFSILVMLTMALLLRELSTSTGRQIRAGSNSVLATARFGSGGSKMLSPIINSSFGAEQARNLPRVDHSLLLSSAAQHSDLEIVLLVAC